MSHDAWPELADVTALGNPPAAASDAQLEAALAAAIKGFKAFTGYDPDWIAGVDNDGTPTDEYFDGNGTNFLNLRGGYVTTADALIVVSGVTWTDGEVDAGPFTSLYTPNHYRLGRELGNAGPVTWLQQVNGGAWDAGAQNIRITGVRGAFDHCPDDVWLAVIEETVARVSAALASAAASSGIQEYEVGRGDERVKYFDPLRARQDALLLSASARAVATRYKRR